MQKKQTRLQLGLCGVDSGVDVKGEAGGMDSEANRKGETNG